MEKINKTAKKTMQKLVSFLDDGYAKLNNGGDGIMPVVVEVIGETKLGRLISVAHYYEQNGDLIADPEVVFQEAEGEYYPISFKQGYLNVFREDVIFEEGLPVGIRKRSQRDNKSFCNMWMKNICYQQQLN